MKAKLIAAVAVALLSMGVVNSADAAPWRNHRYGHGGGYGQREHHGYDRGYRHGHGGGNYGGGHCGGGRHCYR